MRDVLQVPSRFVTAAVILALAAVAAGALLLPPCNPTASDVGLVDEPQNSGRRHTPRVSPAPAPGLQTERNPSAHAESDTTSRVPVAVQRVYVHVTGSVPAKLGSIEPPHLVALGTDEVRFAVRASSGDRPDSFAFDIELPAGNFLLAGVIKSLSSIALAPVRIRALDPSPLVDQAVDSETVTQLLKANEDRFASATSVMLVAPAVSDGIVTFALPTPAWLRVKTRTIDGEPLDNPPLKCRYPLFNDNGVPYQRWVALGSEEYVAVPALTDTMIRANRSAFERDDLLVRFSGFEMVTGLASGEEREVTLTANGIRITHVRIVAGETGEIVTGASVMGSMSDPAAVAHFDPEQSGWTVWVDEAETEFVVCSSLGVTRCAFAYGSRSSPVEIRVSRTSSKQIQCRVNLPPGYVAEPDDRLEVTYTDLTTGRRFHGGKIPIGAEATSVAIAEGYQASIAGASDFLTFRPGRAFETDAVNGWIVFDTLANQILSLTVLGPSGDPFAGRFKFFWNQVATTEGEAEGEWWRRDWDLSGPDYPIRVALPPPPARYVVGVATWEESTGCLVASGELAVLDSNPVELTLRLQPVAKTLHSYRVDAPGLPTGSMVFVSGSSPTYQSAGEVMHHVAWASQSHSRVGDGKWWRSEKHVAIVMSLLAGRFAYPVADGRVDLPDGQRTWHAVVPGYGVFPVRLDETARVAYVDGAPPGYVRVAGRLELPAAPTDGLQLAIRTELASSQSQINSSASFVIDVDANGSFAVHVPPGRYRLRCICNQFDVERNEYQFSAGKEVRVDASGAVPIDGLVIPAPAER